MKNCVERVTACPECLAELAYSETRGLCVQCGAAYTVQDNAVVFCAPPKDVLPEETNYARDKAAWSPFKRRNYAFIEQSIRNLPEGSYILDVGVGPGFFSELFDRLQNYIALDFCRYPGVDLVSDVVKKRIPITSSSIDCLILSNVLEHINKPEKLLLECSRVLTKHGKIVLILPFMFKLHQEPFDFYRYTHHKLRELLEESGFRDIEINKMGTLIEVLRGVKYEYKQILLSHSKHPFLLKQFLRFQYYTDSVIDKLFLNLSEKELEEQDIFVGYSCKAVKSG